MDNYRKFYAPMFHHVPDRRIWSEYIVDQMIFPPDVRRLLRRPPSGRICDTMDGERESHR